MNANLMFKHEEAAGVCDFHIKFTMEKSMGVNGCLELQGKHFYI